MTTYGLTPQGFVVKPLDAILQDIEDDQHANIASDLDVSAESPHGQLNAIFGQALADLWQLAGAVYSARDPAGASFSALDALSALTGTTRKAATHGTVTLTVGLNAGTTLPAGSIAGVPGQPDNLWVTTAAVTNSGGTPGTFPVTATARDAGAISAAAHTITAVSTPVAGWTSVDNAADAVPGAPQEDDPALRTRRQTELAAMGTDTADSIVAAVEALQDTTASAIGSLVKICILVENDSAYADSIGRPPHTMEVIVEWLPTVTGAILTAARTQLATLIWQKTKAARIDTYGLNSQSVLDSNGDAHLVKWTEPLAIPVYISTTISTGTGYAGDAALKTAIKAYCDTITGKLTYAKVAATIVDAAGVLDLLDLRIDVHASPTANANLPAPPYPYQYTFDTANITVSP